MGPLPYEGKEGRPLGSASYGQVVGRKACPAALNRVQEKYGAKLRRPASTSADLTFRLLTMEVLYQLS
jgi:hypothetical protein